MKEWKKWVDQLLEIDRKATYLKNYITNYNPNHRILNEVVTSISDEEIINQTILSTSQLIDLGVLIPFAQSGSSEAQIIENIDVSKLKQHCGILNTFGREVKCGWYEDDVFVSFATLPQGHVVFSEADSEESRKTETAYQIMCASLAGAYYVFRTEYNKDDQEFYLKGYWVENATDLYGFNQVINWVGAARYTIDAPSNVIVWTGEQVILNDHIKVYTFDENNAHLSWLGNTLCTDYVVHTRVGDIIQEDEYLFDDTPPSVTTVFDKTNKIIYTLTIRDQNIPFQLYSKIW